MEEVGSFVPVNPHASEVVSKEVVERVSGKERQAVWNPICLIRNIPVVRFSLSSQITNSLCALLVGSGPNAKCDTIESML